MDAILSDADAEGRRTIEVVLPDQPWLLGAGLKREETYVAALPGGYRIVAASVFQRLTVRTCARRSWT